MIFGQGKTVEKVEQIAQALLARWGDLLLARATAEMASRIAASTPEAEDFSLPGIVRVWRDRTMFGKGKIVAVCAGTSDCR